MIYLADDMLHNMLKNNECVMIDFYAQWCGPCRAIGPQITKLEQNYPDVNFVWVDTDNLKQVAQNESISAMPTFIYYHNGEKLSTTPGANVREVQNKTSSYYDTYGGSAGFTYSITYTMNGGTN